MAGLAFTSQAGVGAEAVTAAPGAQLVVLHVVTARDLDDTDETVNANQAPSLSVTSGSSTAPLQLQVQQDYPTPDDGYFAAAVSVGGPALLTLSEAGLLSQTLDLRTGHRVGTAPEVLYRAADTPAVTVLSSAVSGFAASTDQPGTATGQFGVDTAYLSYWQPYSTTMASDPSKAFLDVEFAKSDLSVPPFPPGDVSPVEALPPGSVTFQLSDGQSVPATLEPGTDRLFDLFTGDFYAEVPADITSVKVSVTVTSVSVQASTDAGVSSQTVTLHFASPLTAQVSLPPPAEFAATATPGRSSGPPAAPAQRRGSKSGSGWPIALAVLAAIVLAAGGATLYRRRGPVILAARPVRWPPAELPAATALLLERGPAGTLLPGRDDPTVAADTPDAGPPSPAQAGPALMIRALGPLEVDGLVKPIRRQSVRRLLVALALSPERPLGADELGMIISDHPDRDPKPKSVHSFASILRGHLPKWVFPAAGADGYRLDPTKVTVDWFVVAAVAGQTSDGPGWAEQATAALELVRGRPLEGGSWEGIEPVVRTMAARVEDLARRLAVLLLRQSDAAGAERAVSRGLAAAPGSVGLWQDRLDAAAAGSGYGLERAWADARASLGPDAGMLAAHYQQLSQSRHADPTAST